LVSYKKNNMQKATRLFDFLDYYLQKFGNKDFIGYKEAGDWKTISISNYIDMVNSLSCGMLKLGVGAGDGTAEGRDKIAILSPNRPEWLCADFATQQIGAVFVPIYPTSNANDLEFIFNDAKVKYIFAGNEELYHKAEALLTKCPTVQKVFCFDKVPQANYWKEACSSGDDHLVKTLQTEKAKIKGDDLATIIYTSGTTGTPKGVMLSHTNIVSNTYNGVESFPFPEQPNSKVLSFLPLNHIFERMVSMIYLLCGLSIYYAENLETIGENLKEVKPVGFTTVPRLLEKVYEKIMQKGMELTGIKRKLFFWAIDLANVYDNNINQGAWYNFKLGIANKIIFSKWREALGGNIKFIISGGAACQVRLQRIFSAAGVDIYEGYGPTENSPVITVNRNTPNGRKFGTVGPVIIGQEVKIMEDGEICVKGPSVMQGYYKRPDITAETIIDGWLHTGDIGVWEDLNGVQFLKITDRKKELFKTSGGKYVAPQPIENKMKESNYIEQIMVVGAEQKFTGAMIVPNLPNVIEWLKKQNISETEPAAIINLPQVKDLFKDVVNSYNENFNPVEQVKKFELLPNEWTIETGELTPTLKLKRKVIMEKYKDAFERIYD
jgi:long-chain acyl-CoA synthetase